jgi:ApaG protein
MIPEHYPFSAETDGIIVSVISFYLAHESNPEDARYMWAYRIRIHNQRAHAVQLLARHWIITDGKGRVEHVRGPGVVGEQPIIEPGEAFEYTSGCPLATPSGFMVGTYSMVNDDGQAFEVEIPAFLLQSPHAGQNVA